MSDNLLYSLNTLQILCTIKNRKIRNSSIFNLLHCPLVRKSLREIALNIIKNNLPLSKTNRKKLRKYKEIIFLLSKRIWCQPLRRVAARIGEILPIIVPLVAKVIKNN